MKLMRWITKFLLTAIFLFILAYANRHRIPAPTELTTLDLITAGGIDISFGGGEGEENKGDEENAAGKKGKSESFSLSYLSSENANPGNDDKNVWNVKSHTFNSAAEQLQSLANKTVKDSHLGYILLGEETARENLSYFIKHYLRTPSIRLDTNVFVTKGMTSEEFFGKALTSDINVNARIDSLLKDRTQVSSFVGRTLKNLLQIYYSEEKTGLIPVLEIIESPVQGDGGGNNNNKEGQEDEIDIDDDDENEDGEEYEESDETGGGEDDGEYTFAFYGLGIIKNGKLVGFIEKELVRTYIILTKNLTASAIEVTDSEGSLSTFGVKNSRNKISFGFDCSGAPVKVNFNVSVDVNFDGTFSCDEILTDENIPVLNNLKNEVIKSEIERIIAKSKETGADFLRLGETFAMRHPYRYRHIRDDWHKIFEGLEYDIQVSSTIKRYFNINVN